MASAKTWIWIIVGFLGMCVLALFAIAGAGVYFVSQHVNLTRTTSAEALRRFDDARSAFKGHAPLIEMDSFGRPRETRSPQTMPTSPVRPTDLVVLAWDPEKERTVRVALPFWLLRLGKQKVDVLQGDRNFDIERLHLDVGELERIGPTFILDYRTPNGERVLVWTQ